MKNEIQYKAGFNQGYLLSKYMPSLFQLIIKSFDNTNDEYLVGIKQGGVEYNLEKNKNKLNDLSELRKNKSQDRDIER